MIKCKDCGMEVDSNLTNCPHCGCLINENISVSSTDGNVLVILSFMFAIFLPLVGLILSIITLNKNFSSKTNSNAKAAFYISILFLIPQIILLILSIIIITKMYF